MPDAPGWYPDPANPLSERYWDGSRWTDHVWTTQVWPPRVSSTPVPPPPVPPWAIRREGESEPSRARAAVVFVMGLLSIFFGWTLIVPILTMYLSSRYEDTLQPGESPNWMARAGWWMAALMLVWWFWEMVQVVPSLLTAAIV